MGKDRSSIRQIDAIKHTDLTQSERDVLKDDATRWRRMGAGGHLDDWLAYQSGLEIRRRPALRLGSPINPKAMAIRRRSRN